MKALACLYPFKNEMKKIKISELKNGYKSCKQLMMKQLKMLKMLQIHLLFARNTQEDLCLEIITNFQ